MTERNPEARCENCPFWFDVGAVNEQGQPVGQCREQPPKLFVLPVTRPVVDAKSILTPQGRNGPAAVGMETQITVQPQLPHTIAEFWCGSHPDLLPEEDDEIVD